MALLRALGSICSATIQLPCTMILSDGLKKRGDIAVVSGAFTDTWRGSYRTKSVALKAFRAYPIQDLKEVEKVRHTTRGFGRWWMRSVHVRSWRLRELRSGVGKGKKGTLLAALYVSDLGMSVKKLTKLLSACQLLVQLIPVPPVISVSHVVIIELVAPTGHYVRCLWSVDIGTGAGSLTPHIADQKRLHRRFPALQRCARLPIVHPPGASGRNAPTWTVQIRPPLTPRKGNFLASSSLPTLRCSPDIDADFRRLQWI